MADMTSNLATKDDVLLLRQDIERFRRSMLMRFDCLEGRFKAIDTRSDSVESRISLAFQNFERRLVLKLGTLMAVLLGLAVTVLKFQG
jgi:hypothetical protein